MPSYATLCLADLQVGQRAIVKRVRDTDPELLRYLAEIRLTPETQFDVLAFSPFDDNLKIQVAGSDEPVVLGPGVTCQIFVEVVS
jgi:DtxR family Mn-dependent transcriptional regulator